MPELLLIAFLILLLFGGAKIPELMRGLGKGMRSFKEGLNEMEKNIKMDGKTPPHTPSEKTDTEKDTKSE